MLNSTTMSWLLLISCLITTSIRAECNYVGADNGNGEPNWGNAKAPGYCFGAQSAYTSSYKYICNGQDLIYRQYTNSQTCNDDTTYYDTNYITSTYIGPLLWNCAGLTCVLNYRQYTWDCPWDSYNCSDIQIETAETNCDTSSTYTQWYEEAGIPGKCTSLTDRSFFISCNQNNKAIITEIYQTIDCSGTKQRIEYGSQSCATAGLYYNVFECDLGSPTQTTTKRPTHMPTNRPTTVHPTISPTTPYPTLPTLSPTTAEPTSQTSSPTKHPTSNPTVQTVSPTDAPSIITTSPTETPIDRGNSNGVQSMNMRVCIVCLLLPLLYFM